MVAAAHEADPDSLLMVGQAMGVAALRGDLASCIAIGRAGVEQARHAGDPRLLSYLLSLLALGEITVDPTLALAHAEEAVEVARTSPATSALIYPLCQLSVVLVSLRGDPDRALAVAEESIALDRTHRRAWSTLSEGSAARLRVDRGEVATGLRLLNDVLRRLDWSGELGYLSMQLPGLADAIAHLDPTFALDLAAIADSGIIAPFPAFDMLQSFEALAAAVDELGPGAVEAARSRATTMSYDDAVGYLFDNIERLVTEVEVAPSDPPQERK